MCLFFLITGLADAFPEWLKLGNRVLLTSRPYGLCSDDRRRVNLPVAELAEHLNPPERAHLWRALGRLGLDDLPGGWGTLLPTR